MARRVRGAAAVVARCRRQCPISRPPTAASPRRRPQRQRLRVAANRRRRRLVRLFRPRRRPPAGHRRIDAQRVDQVGPAGLQLAVRVVLAASDRSAIGPAGGRRFSPARLTPTSAAGSSCGLPAFPGCLTRQIHVLRMQFGPQVDGREAYVDAVLLNVYGGPGVTNVWIDDLEVAGHVGAAADSLARPAAGCLAAATADSTRRGPSLVPVRLPPVQPDVERGDRFIAGARLRRLHRRPSSGTGETGGIGAVGRRSAHVPPRDPTSRRAAGRA